MKHDNFIGNEMKGNIFSKRQHPSGKNEKAVYSFTFCIILITAFLTLNSTDALADHLTSLPSSVKNETDGFLYPDKPGKKYFKKIFEDLSLITVCPLTWQPDSWQNFGVGLVTAGTIFAVDNSIHLWMKDIQDSSPDLINSARFFSRLGNPSTLVGVTLGGYLAGTLIPSKKTRQTFLLVAETLLITEIYVQILKTTSGRARPFTEEGPFSFHPLSFRYRWTSFPSGHSAVAWALAGSISSISENFLLRASVFILASAISISRAVLDQHFASDIFIGSFFGYFIGQKIVSINSDKQKMSGDARPVKIQVGAGPGFISMSIIF